MEHTKEEGGKKGGQVHKKVTVQSAERRRGSGIYIIKLMDVNFTLASGVGEWLLPLGGREDVCVCGCVRVTHVWVCELEFFFSCPGSDLECQLGYTYPLSLLASLPLSFYYYSILRPPGPKSVRAAVHSRKRSEPFLLLFSITPPLLLLPSSSTSRSYVLLLFSCLHTNFHSLTHSVC